MKRLKKGEFLLMSPEQQRAHKAALQRKWRAANKEAVRERNKMWWEYYRDEKPFLCVCHICGKKFGASRKYFVTCRDCIDKRIAHNAAIKQAIKDRQKAKKKRNALIIRLHKKGLLQREIAARFNINQGAVSYILRMNGYRTLEKRTRK